MNRQHQSRNKEKDFAPNPRHLRNERERESDTTLSVQHQNFNGNLFSKFYCNFFIRKIYIYDRKFPYI
jgi:hypothetical protein